ncbi:MAG TPA: hypothetical protein VHR65_02960 [Solirubrobacterales bacterium]|nr:hypothetical protein [Solirubrobacterales bacterium]
MTFVSVVFGAGISGTLAWLLANADRSEVIGVGLAFAALIYALRQFNDAGQTLSRIGDVNENLNKLTGRLDDSVGDIGERLQESVKSLEGQLSTKQLGLFPDFMPDIVDLLDEAEGEVLICCDHPAYGVFSAFSEYESYATAIQRKVKQGIPVSLLCNDEARCEELREIQITIGGEWSKWRQKENMRDFLTKYGDTKQRWSVRLWPVRIDKDEFLEVLAKADERALLEVFAGVPAGRKVKTHDVLPIYFWMASGTRKRKARAVFAMASLTEGAFEVGFQTEDPGLILALKGIFGRYKEVDRERDHARCDVEASDGAASIAEIAKQSDE